MSEPLPKLYTIREAAELTRRSTSWLYRNVGKTIPAMQATPGGRIYFTAEQIKQIIALREVRPGTKQPATASSTPTRGKRRPAAAKPAPASTGTATVTPLRARPEARRKRGGRTA